MADDPDEEDSVSERYKLILGFLRDQRFPGY